MLPRLFVVLGVFFMVTSVANAQEVITQTVNLSPGWNIVSTPKVLASHEFSAAETAQNFDIYLLDASKPTGWATMSDLGQTEFEPLYGYFIQNKTESDQSLTFTYNTDLPPNEKLFERTFNEPGWYSIGVANSGFAIPADGLYGDTNNPSNILSLLNGAYDLFIDFTDASYQSSRQSVMLAEPWKVGLPNNINSINDLRETKGYVLYITEEGARYNGIQGSDDSQPVPDGAPIELKVTSSSQNNEPRQIQLYDGEGVTDEVVLFFQVENESDTDVTLQDFSIDVSSTGADASEIINSLTASAAYIAWSPIASSSATVESPGEFATVVFQGLNLQIDAWEQAMIQVRINTNAFNGNFDEGDSLTFSTNPQQTGWSAKDEYNNSLDRTYSTGDATGGPYEFIVGQPISIPADGFSSEVDTLGTNDTIGEFTLEFEVTALGDDYYITDNSSLASTSPTDGVTFNVDGTVGAGIVSASFTSTADEDTSGVFTVREGETETFTLTVVVDPQSTGAFRAGLFSLWYSENIDGLLGTEYLFLPLTDFDTAMQSIQGS